MTMTDMPLPLSAHVALLVLAVASSALAAPQVVRTQFGTDDVVIAEVVLEPPADGADAAPMLQEAIESVAELGGGVVFCPSGRYRLAGPVVIREGVTVRGDRPRNAREPGIVEGTIMMPVHGRGEEDGAPAFTLERGSGVRDLTVWYPDQLASEVVPYPWTFRGSAEVSGDNTTIRNVTLINSYQGIKIGPEWNELHTIRDVYGTALRCGFWGDTCTDIGRVIDVSLGPEWWERSGLPGAPTSAADAAGVRDLMATQGIGIDMGRSDWEYLYGVTLRGYSVGVRFRPGEQGTTNAVLYAIETPECGTGLLVEALNGIGIAATGCAFDGTQASVHAPASLANTVVQLNTCTLSGSPAHNILLEGPATVTAVNCNLSGSRESAVMATRGRISLLGCEIDGAGDSVVLGEGLELARILGNVFAGEPLIRNAAELGRVQVAHTGIEFAAFDPPRPPVRPDPRPATDEVFVVTDFGASPGNDDNTSAFAGALAAAAAAGGGTVYVPAGNYTVAGALTVPSGVEMRGCFDVPHHTISGGSVLMPTGGRGEEDGQPFVSLAERSGLRGLTFWYPEQNPRDIQPYPWTIRALGSDCWLIDLALGNAYQGADLWTYPSDRHLVRYYSGGFFRRGLFVSKSVDGLVEDVQYNPHYMFRLHPSLPNPGYDGDAWPLVCDEYVRGNLEGMVFGACEDELMLRNFLYAAHDGLVFRKDDDRGTTGVVVNHGTDTGSRCLVVEGVGEAGLTMFNSQLVPLGKYEVGAIIIEDDFDGRLALVNSQLWAGNTSGIIGGAGDVLIQQMNTISGLMRLEGGRVRLDSIVFQRDLEEHVRASEGVAEATLIANLGPRSFAVANEAGDACRAIGSASSLPMPADANTAYEFASGLEAGDPQPIADTIAEPGGGMRTVSDGTCRVVTADAHTGDAALRIAGNADDPEYSYIYFRVFDVSLGILADSVLSYWVRPGNELGRHIGLDLVFAEGGMLRLDGDGPREGGGVHPGGQQVGPVGEWRQVSLPLGRHAGKRISAMMVAYDSRSGGGAFEALIDDIRLSSDDAHSPAMPRVEPTGGPIAAGAAVTITPPPGVSALVSLNGLDPTPESPVYTVPIVLAEPGLVELRIRPVAPDGTLSTHVRTELYEVLPM